MLNSTQNSLIENRLVFQDEGHKYFRVNRPDDIWKSVTTVVKHYSEPFKREEWLAYKAMERVLSEDKFKDIKDQVKESYGGFNYHGVMELCWPLVSFEDYTEAKAEIEAEWTEEGLTSAARGTAGHLKLENESYSRGKELNLINNIEYNVFPKQNFEYDNEQLAENLFDLEDGYYPELLTWFEIDEERKTCGQSDGVFIRTEGSKRYVTVRDYKFVKAKKMNTQNFCSIARQNVMMREPISHIPCSKIHGYQLQMSIYGWMLQNAGYVVEGIWLDHFNEKLKKKIIKLDYLEKEAESVILDWCS